MVDTDDEGWELISSYSRQQAIEDGILVDVSGVAPQLTLSASVGSAAAGAVVAWLAGAGAVPPQAASIITSAAKRRTTDQKRLRFMDGASFANWIRSPHTE